MAELPACRRSTDLVGGDTACQRVGSRTRAPPALRLLNARSTCSAALPAAARAVRRQSGDHCLTFFPSPKFGRSILSSAPSRAKNPSRCAWWPGNCAAVARCRLWRDEFGVAPPYPTGPDVLFVAYYASAEIGCHLALGWPVPERVLDLFTEFRNHTNGIPTVSGAGLLGALAHLRPGRHRHRREGRNARPGLARRPMDRTPNGRRFSTTARATWRRWRGCCRRMLPDIDLPRALLRGRYMAAAARMERNGVPIDTATLELLRSDTGRTFRTS